MPINNFTVGRDVTLVVTTSSGTLNLPGLTGFQAKPMTSKLKSKGIDGTPRFGVIPDGWQGSFKLDRLSADADTFWANYEAGYFAGQNQVAGTIYETITEANGSVSQWRYEGVVLTFEDAGDFSGDKKVEQTISFEAARKKAVSGNVV